MTDNIKNNEESFLNIAVNAALGVKGVSGMSSILTDSLKSIPGLGAPVRGARMSIDNGELIFDLFINVDYGVKIPQLAWEIQSTVKVAINRVTDHKIKEVNIHVQGVDFPGEEDR
jgi:uncharacterized alkaline shock family protein YloU